MGSGRRAPLELDRAVKVFRALNARPPHELRAVKLDLRRPLVRVGEVPELHYISDKEGTPTHYYHKVGSPGVLYADPDGRYFLLVGGSTRIRGKWLTENPTRRLSRANMARALRAFDNLTPGEVRKIDDEIAWLMAAAWKIQRARKRRRGTR